VLWDGDGWQITAEGRNFLRAFEAVIQDNRLAEAEQPESDDAGNTVCPSAALVVGGHRFKNPAALTTRSLDFQVRSRLPGKNDNHHLIWRRGPYLNGARVQAGFTRD
jgi:hypothetical protein